MLTAQLILALQLFNRPCLLSSLFFHFFLSSGMLVGLTTPTAGDALFPGNLSIVRDMHSIRRNLGVCPQHDILFPELTVTQHLQVCVFSFCFKFVTLYYLLCVCCATGFSFFFRIHHHVSSRDNNKIVSFRSTPPSRVCRAARWPPQRSQCWQKWGSPRRPTVEAALCPGVRSANSVWALR